MKACVRCTSTKKLEEDHIIPKSLGGSDDPENKRWLCYGCHKYRHVRDKVVAEINKQLRLSVNGFHNCSRLGMWLFRLGVLEAFNTPERIRRDGTYVKYWDLNATHYSAWYPKIKLHTASSRHFLVELGIKIKKIKLV